MLHNGAVAPMVEQETEDLRVVSSTLTSTTYTCLAQLGRAAVSKTEGYRFDSYDTCIFPYSVMVNTLDFGSNSSSSSLDGGSYGGIRLMVGHEFVKLHVPVRFWYITHLHP